MNIEQTVLEKLRALSSDKQREVLVFIESLEQKANEGPRTGEERAVAFRRWALSHSGGPGLSDEALRRENVYE
jgi:hypothetical protein